MLEALFTSTTRIKILNLLLTNPDSEFYMRQLSRETGENMNSVLRETRNLESFGIVDVKGKGNLKFVKINTESCIFPELHSIFQKIENFLPSLKKEMEDKVEYAFIHGSYAHGRIAGGVDLLTIGESDFHIEAGREIHRIHLSMDELRKKIKLKDPLLLSIMKSKKIFLIGEEKKLMEELEEKRV
jgi:DNA-binding transcriptional regulator YhcF (GntR family)